MRIQMRMQNVVFVLLPACSCVRGLNYCLPTRLFGLDNGLWLCIPSGAKEKQLPVAVAAHTAYEQLD